VFEQVMPKGWMVGKLAIGKGLFPVMAYRVLLAVETFGAAHFERGDKDEMEIREVVGFLMQICDRHGLRFVADGGVLMQPASMNNVMSARGWLVFNPKAATAWPDEETDDGKETEEAAGHEVDPLRTERADGVRQPQEEEQDDRGDALRSPLRAEHDDPAGRLQDVPEGG
jgi:hypothetical protein